MLIPWNDISIFILSLLLIVIVTGISAPIPEKIPVKRTDLILLILSIPPSAVTCLVITSSTVWAFILALTAIKNIKAKNDLTYFILLCLVEIILINIQI